MASPSFGLRGRGKPLGGLEKGIESLDCVNDAVVETENLEDKACGKGLLSASARRCIWAIRLRLVRMNTMTARVNESRPMNENTVMIAIKDPASPGVDVALFCGDGDNVGCDAPWELELGCTFCADKNKVCVG